MIDMNSTIDEFILYESSHETECMDGEALADRRARMRVKRKISKRKGQNYGFRGKASV
jgi:hypothetical protein